MRRWRRGRVVLAIAVLAFFALGLVLRSERAGAWVCSQARERAPELIGQALHIERCAIDPLTASVELMGLRVGPPERPVIEAQLASVSLAGVFSRGVSLQHVTVVKPVVTVELQGGPEGEASCPLDVLTRVRVASLEVQDGVVTVRQASGEELRLDGIEVRARLGPGHAEVEASVSRGAVTVGERRVAIGRVSLDATLDPAEQALEVQRVEASVEGLSVTGSGELRELCRTPHVDANGQLFVPIAALARLGVPLPEPASGQVWARVLVSGALDALSARAELRASQVVLGEFTPGELSAKVGLSEGVVRLDELHTQVGDGDVRLSGELKLTQGFPVKAKIATKDASLARALARASVPGAWVDFPASVTGEVTGRLVPLSLSGPMELSTGPFLLATRAYDAPARDGDDVLAFSSARGTFGFQVTPSAVTFTDVSLAVGARGATRVKGQVRLGITDGPPLLDIDATATALDLSDFGHISGLPWAGTGTASVRVVGPAGTARITGQTSLRDFKLDGYSLGVVQTPLLYEGDTLAFEGLVAQKGRTQIFGDVFLDFLAAGLHTRASVQVPDGRVEDVVELLVDLSPSMQNLQDVLVGRIALVAAFDAPAKAFEGVIAARVSDVAYFDRRFGSSSLVLKFEEGQRLALDPATFEGPLGRVAVSGTWDFDGPLDYRVAWDEGSVAEALDPGGHKGLDVDGALTGSFVISGTTDLYRVDGSVRLPELTWRGRRLGPSALTLGVVGRELSVRGTVATGVEGRLGLKMRNDWPFDASFTVDLPELGGFLPDSVKGLQVGVAGAVTAVGPARDVSQARLSAYLDKVTVGRGEVTASNVAPVELGWNSGVVQVKSLAMKGPTTEVSAEGVWGPQRVDLRARGGVDLRLLSALVPQVERTSGRLDFTAGFGGTGAAPTVLGSAELVDAKLSVKGEDLSVRALSGQANFSESRVVLHDVTGILNDGRVKARGDLRLERLKLGAMELQVDLEEVTVRPRPTIPATVSGSLLLATRGNGAPYQLSGGVEIEKFRYAEPMTLETLLETARKRPVPSDTQPAEWLRFDVDVACGNDVRIENDLKARVLGKLKLAGTNVKPLLIGSLEAATGAQAFFRNNTYSVSRAVLQFNGLWPTFDVSAQTVVREFLVSVKAFGRFEDPKLTLTSEPALSSADIVSLLTVGVTSKESLAGQTGAALAAEAVLSATGFDRQVQKFLSQNVRLKDPQLRLTTTFNEATGASEPSVSWESKLILDNLKVGVTQPVTGRGTKAQVEWRFNQNVSTRFQWDNQNQNTTIGNPGGDLRFRFEWE